VLVCSLDTLVCLNVTEIPKIDALRAKNSKYCAVVPKSVLLVQIVVKVGEKALHKLCDGQ
jgi:hypothetical protein